MSEDIEYQGTSYLQLLILFSAVFIDLVGFGIVIPILPLLNERLGGTSLDYGMIIAIYSLMQFIFSPIWGNLSDKIGRKPIIILGLTGESIGFALFGFAHELWMVYFARAVAGIFTAATLTTANTYIADTTAPEDRATGFGLLSAAFGLGFALGPGVGGIFADYHKLDFLLIQVVPIMGSHVLPSFVAAGLAIVAMLASLIFLPESLKEKVDTNVVKRNRFPIMDTFNYVDSKNTILYLAIFGFVGLGLSVFMTAFPNYALVLDPTVNEVTLGYSFMLIGILLFATQTFFIRPLVRRFGEAPIVRAGLFFMIFGFIGVSIAPTYYSTFIPIFFFTIGIAMLLPTVKGLISNSVSDKDQANILGISQAWAAFARIIGPVMAGYLFGLQILLPFTVGIGIFIVLFVISFSKITESPGKVFGISPMEREVLATPLLEID